MRTIGNETKPQVLSKGKISLENVIVPRKLHWATIAEMGDHAQPVVDGGL